MECVDNRRKEKEERRETGTSREEEEGTARERGERTLGRKWRRKRLHFESLSSRAALFTARPAGHSRPLQAPGATARCSTAAGHGSRLRFSCERAEARDPLGCSRRTRECPAGQAAALSMAMWPPS
ncbi:unnamed protein product [Lampetra fluviatilis]